VAGSAAHNVNAVNQMANMVASMAGNAVMRGFVFMAVTLPNWRQTLN